MSEPTTFWDVLRTGAILAGTGGGLILAYQLGKQVYDDWHERYVKAKQDAATIADIEQQVKLSGVRQIRPDSAGRLGVAFDGTRFRDLDSLRLYDMLSTRFLAPTLEKVVAIQTLLQAGRGWPAPPAQAQLIEAGQADTPDPWADLRRVPLRGLLEGPPSFRRLVLGVTVNDQGEREIVTADMAQLVHVGVGGSSGWGKSVFLRSLAFQLAKSTDPVDLAMIDLEGATLAPFAACGRLLWPIGDTEQDAACILRELTGELDRRKALFAKHPGVDSLYTYNAQANGGALDPLVCLIDEATALLENKEVEGQLRTLALRARKYGVWCVLAGQDWKASSLDTAIRNQLSTRVQFKAMSDSQSRVLLQRSGAEAIEVKGRALAWIPGRDICTLQAPLIGYDDILAAMGNGQGPKHAMPVILATEPEVKPRPWTTEQEQRVLELHAQGESDTAIAGALWHRTSYYIDRVRAIIAENAQVDDPEPGAIDWCEFCDTESGPFSECAGCGVAVCAGCMNDRGRCPDCTQEEE